MIRNRDPSVADGLQALHTIPGVSREHLDGETPSLGQIEEKLSHRAKVHLSSGDEFLLGQGIGKPGIPLDGAKILEHPARPPESQIYLGHLSQICVLQMGQGKPESVPRFTGIHMGIVGNWGSIRPLTRSEPAGQLRKAPVI